jgi:hypothetical protein
VSDDGSQTPAQPSRREILPVGRRGARRLAWMYTAAAAILLPWIVYLAATLPRRQYDRHYRAAWVGFDLLLVFRVDQRVQFPAIATATLLVVDAWFDMTTSANRSQFVEAFVLAAVVEIPAAVFSIYVARQVNRRILEAARAAGSGPAANEGGRYRRRRQESTGHAEE